MLVIHGVWAHGALRVWAEDSGLPAAVPSRQGRTVAPLRPHPFAAPAGPLADVLAERPDLSDPVRKATEDELTLWLPGTSARPAGSPDLTDLAAGSGTPAGASLTPWQIPVLTLDADAALALLRVVGLADARLADGVFAGSTRYLAALAALAADLAARARVLPGLHGEDDGGYTARWRPVLTGADALRA
ncbi:MAG: ATP-dependent helicase, partial [Streptosporangiaceae bacterium]